MTKKIIAREKKKYNPKRGEIYLADLNPRKGSEQSGIRPVLVLQNNIVNSVFKTTIVAAISSGQGAISAKKFPSNAFIKKRGNLKNDSSVKLTQIMVVDTEERFIKYIDTLSNEEMKLVEKAIDFNLELGEKCNICGSKIEENKLICKKCKSEVKKECFKCKSILQLEWKYCPNCGKEV